MALKAWAYADIRSAVTSVRHWAFVAAHPDDPVVSPKYVGMGNIHERRKRRLVVTNLHAYRANAELIGLLDILEQAARPLPDWALFCVRRAGRAGGHSWACGVQGLGAASAIRRRTRHCRPRRLSLRTGRRAGAGRRHLHPSCSRGTLLKGSPSRRAELGRRATAGSDQLTIADANDCAQICQATTADLASGTASRLTNANYLRRNT